jgi:hypothetical protein
LYYNNYGFVKCFRVTITKIIAIAIMTLKPATKIMPLTRAWS